MNLAARDALDYIEQCAHSGLHFEDFDPAAQLDLYRCYFGGAT